MTTHAGTKEREILDNLLTDLTIKAMDRNVLEDLIERIAGDLVLQVDELNSVIADLEEKNSELQDQVATYRMFITNLKLGLDELVGD